MMLFIMVAVLSAWDLLSLAGRLNKVAVESIDRGILRRHMARLVAVDAAGLLLGGFGLLLKVNLNFGLELLLGLAVAVGISQLILILRRSNG